MLKNKISWVLAAAIMLALGACHKAEAPAKVQQDVANAQESAAKSTEKAEASESKVDTKADSNLATEQDKAGSQKENAAADTATTEAEGAYKVAMAKCESLSGDRQAACKEEAKAQLDMAKAKAKAMKADTH